MRSSLDSLSQPDTDKISHLPLIEFPSLDLAPQQPAWMRRPPLQISSYVPPSVLGDNLPSRDENA